MTKLGKLLTPLLQPGWPDEARRVIQEPVFREAAARGLPRGRCLNAGSGEGLFIGFLESFHEITEIINVDVTPPRISQLHADPRHREMVGSITTLQIDDESIDWVLCTEVLEHINCDSAAARELGRVLRKGGFALVSVPRPPAPFDPAHVREGYSLEDLSKLLAVGGLELVGHWYCMHLFMRALARVWRYQYEHLGRKRRSLMPRLAVLVFAYVDRWFRIGSPWDIVVLARRV